MWGGLLPHFTSWARGNALYQIRLMQRDMHPAQLLTGWRDIWLTRKICGIADELAHSETSEHRLLSDYIAQETGGRPFTMVDSGCWGSIVMNLRAKGVMFQPLFFFSRNPDIRSFLTGTDVRNAIRGMVPRSDIGGFLGALNDTYECCVPKRFRSPDILRKTLSGIRPQLAPSDKISVMASDEFEYGLKNAPRGRLGDALQAFASEYPRARRGESAVMTAGSPIWSEGAAFLQKFRERVKVREYE
jgi:hypothetical protein